MSAYKDPRERPVRIRDGYEILEIPPPDPWDVIQAQFVEIERLRAKVRELRGYYLDAMKWRGHKCSP